MLNEIKSILVMQLNIDPLNITEDSNLIELGADSLDLTELCMSLEVIYKIDISEEQEVELITVGDILKLLSSIQNQ